MTDVDCADTCSSQRGLRREISIVENGVTVNAIGLNHQVDGELYQKDLASQTKKLEELQDYLHNIKHPVTVVLKWKFK